jgi:hypothetical protein
MKPRNLHLRLAGRQVLSASWLVFVTSTLLALALDAPARSQEPTAPAQSVTEAARNTRQQRSNSSKNAKVITNDDFSSASPSPSPSTVAAALATSPESTAKQAEEPPQSSINCDSPDDERIKGELQAAQDELDQTRHELNQDPKVISDGDVDMSNFKPGSSGVAFGSPPLSDAQPQSPARINEVMLDQRVASLKKAAQIACDTPKGAEIQEELDSAESQLKLLQSQFDLDQSSYYSKPGYSGDTAGKAKLDAEQQQIQSLQAEVDRLKSELPAAQTNRVAE